MNDSSKNVINHSFVPILALDCPLKDLVTPYNFISFELAYQAYKLQLLSSVPLGLFSGIKSNEQSIIIEFTYNPDGLVHVAENLAATRRPVILWISKSSSNRVEQLVRRVQSFNPFFLLIITEETEVAALVEPVIKDWPLASVICLGEYFLKTGDGPLQIWKAYLELLVKIEKSLPVGELLLNVAPDRSINREFSDILAMAQSGELADATSALPAIPLYDDFIYYPNAIIANHLRYKIPVWSASSPETIKNNRSKVYELSTEILSRKALNLLIDQIFYARSIIKEKKQLPITVASNIFFYEQILPAHFFEPLKNILNGSLPDEKIMDVLKVAHVNYPKELLSIAIPEFMLVCQSYPFDYKEANFIATSLPGYSIEYIGKEDANLYQQYYDMINQGGRHIAIQTLNDDPKDEAIIKILARFSIMENNFVSAISVFYGMRRQCPVFKTQKAGRAIFDLFHQLDSLFAQFNNRSIDRPNPAEDPIYTKIESLMNLLSDKLTELIDPEILEKIFSTNLNPRLFLLSDIPLDFVKISSDFLGYSALLNRLPVTPGSLLSDYYNKTTSLTDLDNDQEQTVIVTSFVMGSKERDYLNSTVKAFKYDQIVRILPILSRFDLINYVNNNHDIKCLVFFGHGGIDRKVNESWIQLPRDNFYKSDIARLKYIPKTIVLVGCNTSSGGNTISGMDVPFLQRGAQVVATTFPIPLVLGASFIGLFLSNFLSAGVHMANFVRYYTDLSDILTIVKRRMRINSILINLIAQNKIKDDDTDELLNLYVEKMQQLEVKDQGNDQNPFNAIKQALFEKKLIVSMDVPFYEIEKIPYCLFFTCLGYTWSNKNKNLSI